MAQRRGQKEGRSSPWIGPLILAAIILYAAIVGSLLLFQLQESPFSRHPVTDEEAYITQAQGILAGTYPGEAVFYQSPLYPYLLALNFPWNQFPSDLSIAGKPRFLSLKRLSW